MIPSNYKGEENAWLEYAQIRGNSTDPGANTSTSLGLLFFVAAIIYFIFLLLVIFRTARLVFGIARYGNSKPMKVFRLFYAMIWVQMFLNSILYWTLFGQEIGRYQDTTDDKDQMKFLALLMFPSILMALDYALLYYQFESLQQNSRVQGGVAYIKRFESKKLEKCINTILFVYVGIFTTI